MPAKLAPRGPEFQVNQVTQNSQYEPDVAALADGRFVVVYTTAFDPAAGDYDVLGQLVNADGTLSGSTLFIQHPTGDQDEPAVAARLDGGFTTVWRDYGTGAPVLDTDI